MTILFLFTGTASMTVFLAELEDWLPRNMPVVWVTVIVGAMCLTGKRFYFVLTLLENSFNWVV